jgi:hypothetical protein
MAEYRDKLPQLDGDVFLADGGIETTLIFDDGVDLPDFAAFHLMSDPDGEQALRRYFDTYAALANRDGVGIVLETATWRAGSDWATKLGYSTDELAERGRGARPGRPRRAGRRISRATHDRRAAHRARGLLRHRPQPCGRHQRRLRPAVISLDASTVVTRP